MSLITELQQEYRYLLWSYVQDYTTPSKTSLFDFFRMFTIDLKQRIHSNMLHFKGEQLTQLQDIDKRLRNLWNNKIGNKRKIPISKGEQGKFRLSIDKSISWEEIITNGAQLHGEFL